MAHVLIIDDDKAVCKMLSEMVKRLEHDATTAFTLKDGLKEAVSKDFDVVFLDVMLPDGSGLDILPQIRETALSPEVIIMTGYGSVDGAEIAIKSGAWDYIQKPLTPKKIILPLKRILQYHDELKKAEKIAVSLKLNGIVGSSRQMKACFDLIAQAANSEANVLITGETGTGKELFAKAIHANSPRAKKSWVVVDCTVIPETLAESVLFGHEKGAFTGAERAKDGLIIQAHGGTLFLDEVGELTLQLQKAFLRVLQERRFRSVGGEQEVESNFRLIAVTNRDIDQLVKKDKFREDLFYRLKAIEINIPPLRERPEDLKELILSYINKLCEGYGLLTKSLSPDFFDALAAYDWPGNVRELINTLERALAQSQQGPVLFSKHLPTNIRIQAAKASISKEDLSTGDSGKVPVSSFKFPRFKDYKENLLVEVEKEYLQELMSFTQGSVKEACQISGLGRTWLYTLLKKHGISRLGWSLADPSA